MQLEMIMFNIYVTLNVRKSAVFGLFLLHISESIRNILVKFSVHVKNNMDNWQKAWDGAIQHIGSFMTVTMQIYAKASLFLN